MTVGSGIKPDLLTLRHVPEALAGFGYFPVTAGGEFHPALRTCVHLAIEMIRAATVSRGASRARPNLPIDPPDIQKAR